MTTTVLLRSGMMGNYHVPFCRAVEGATPSLTLIYVIIGIAPCFSVCCGSKAIDEPAKVRSIALFCLLGFACADQSVMERLGRFIVEVLYVLL
jgi:uncharacterized membrane protein YuzA (DUF378 family)